MRRRKPKSSKGKTSLDVHVGNRIRERRVALGLTRFQVADMIGVTYHQVIKYELGLNRLWAGQLYVIARALDVPVTSCFEGFGARPAPHTASQRRLIEFTRNFSEIQNEQYKEVLFTIVRLLAAR